MSALDFETAFHARDVSRRQVSRREALVYIVSPDARTECFGFQKLADKQASAHVNVLWCLYTRAPDLLHSTQPEMPGC